ncbi:Uma2 family endonuclease [Dapis sp. BLCC M126]|uniref:Uma2 family endonuclease n=1 Tax=Dapis sp. BLCC M126 TaxID=3400189 RepID=UPI003CEF6963
MIQQLTTDTKSENIYPDSDGQLMADNTKQFRWIVTIKENLEILFAEVADIFVAGDFLWYPVKGNNKIRQAPDVMVVFGRPKGDRGSYKQWEENNIAPQVVFEILSPGNRPQEMTRKLLFYQQYGVEEYYIYDPDENDFVGSIRVGMSLEAIPEINGWVSPRLGISFQLTAETLEIYRPDGDKFFTSVELDQLRELEKQRAEQIQQQLDQEKQRAEQIQQQLEQEKQRADRLAEILRQKGIDPDNV